jgi:hypothetical protein
MPLDSEHHQLSVYPPTRESMPGEATDSEPLLVEEEDAIQTPRQHASIWRLRTSFFLFGTINNGEPRLTHSRLLLILSDYTLSVLYVIILSAALDLVPQGTPKVAF